MNWGNGIRWMCLLSGRSFHFGDGQSVNPPTTLALILLTRRLGVAPSRATRQFVASLAGFAYRLDQLPVAQRLDFGMHLPSA